MFKTYVYIERNAQIDKVIPMYKDVYVIKMFIQIYKDAYVFIFFISFIQIFIFISRCEPNVRRSSIMALQHTFAINA